MRRSWLALALVLAACSGKAGTAGLSSPSPLAPTSARPSPTAAPTTRALSAPSRTAATTSTPAPRRTGVVSPGALPSATQTLSPSPKPVVTPSPTHAAGAKTWVMTISGFMFSPDTPSIHVGDSIKVTNKDPDTHTFTAKNGAFDSGHLGQNQSATLRFTKAGVFDFECSVHPFMTGQLTVSA